MISNKNCLFNTRHNKIKLLFLLFVILIFNSCNNDNQNYIEESGTIEATEIVISSQVAGKVIKILKDEGDKVSAGDTILIIDQETLLIQLKQAIANRDIAKAQYDLLVKGARKEDIKQVEESLKQAEANFILAKNDKDRMENLYQTNSINRRQYEEALTRYEVALAQLNSAKELYNKIKNYARPEEIAQAKANYEKAEASVELIKKSIRDCFVTSPINGFVVKKFVEIGETVSMMSSLVKISDLTEVKLSIYVSEIDLGKIKPGQKAEVSIDSFKDKVYEGTVIYISPEAEFTPKNIQTKDERTKLVFEVKIKIPNPNFELKAGMPADAVIKF
ncbi:efflux RND transporter periplasmic adaptor subunit [Ignavibacteria bacterium 4148-Me]|uniref:HlyD family secretion protein n=1 Tax=Rosettibacter primus TaxID=3111523 RepID=UPI00336C10B5